MKVKTALISFFLLIVVTEILMLSLVDVKDLRLTEPRHNEGLR